MRKLIELEIGLELAIDADQQVAVERRRDAERIVVGQQQILFGLDEIGADEQPIALAQGAADAGQQRVTRRRIEVADVGAEKQRQHAARAAPRGDGLGEPRLVRRLVPHDFDRLRPIQRRRALSIPSGVVE